MELWPAILFVVFLLFTWVENGIDGADEIRKSKIVNVNASSKLDFGAGKAGVGFNPGGKTSYCMLHGINSTNNIAVLYD